MALVWSGRSPVALSPAIVLGGFSDIFTGPAFFVLWNERQGRKFQSLSN